MDLLCLIQINVCMYVCIFVITFASFERSNDQRPPNGNWQIADIIFVDERNSCKRPYAFSLRR